MARILVVDDEKGMREFLSVLLEDGGHTVVLASHGQEALATAQENPVDLVISDVRMPLLDGVGLLKGLHELDPHLPVILMTAYASAESAVQAMKRGAYDYLIKPFKVDELKLVIAKALETRQLRRENLLLKQELKGKTPFPGIIGTSSQMVGLYELIAKVAPLTSTVLITGESGTGKELVARAIHDSGPRSAKPFLAINCGAIPEALLESELFGHVKGSFTGAVAHKAGLFEVANGGTVFLDEIADMPLTLQVKILRVLQDKIFRRVGGTEDIKVDVRVIAASNKDIQAAVASGRFREDLFYRLNVIPLLLPPLRERRGDIALLVKEFLARYGGSSHKEEVTVAPEALQLLEQYEWPGNIRELENVIERAVALGGSRITAESLPDQVRERRPTQVGAPYMAPVLREPSLPSAEGGVDLDGALAEIEKRLILDALQKSGGVQKRAAEILRITFRSFRHRLKKYGLSPHKVGARGEGAPPKPPQG